MSMFRKNLLCQNHTYYNDTSLLQLETVTIGSKLKFVLYSLSGERCHNKTKLDWPNPFEEADPEFDVVGSGNINGILCLVSKSQPNNRVVSGIQLPMNLRLFLLAFVSLHTMWMLKLLGMVLAMFLLEMNIS